MNKKYKLILKIAGIILIIILGALFFKEYAVKAHSPEETVVYQDESLELEVFYNRPSKKEREIFGGLVPYGEVWRTGANEATTFLTNEELLVDGSVLKAGKYTLWTIPMEDSWKVIFNSQMYPWGIDLDGKAYRDPQFDVLILEAPTLKLKDTLEQFSIYFEKYNELVFLKMAWDTTKIEVPIKAKKEAQSALLLSN
ncbi:MAG: DUF2911 domain-containing protein [Bacteroidota bacterium]